MHDNFPCRDFSKSYLQCRMDNHLMAKEDLNTLGFDKDRVYIRKPQEERENTVVVAGTGVKPSSKWFN